MDIVREDIAEKKRKKRILLAASAATVVLLITLGLSRLKPAAPSVEKGTLWVDTVHRGPMLRQVGGRARWSSSRRAPGFFPPGPTRAWSAS